MYSDKDAGGVNRALELTYGCGVSLFRAAQLEWTALQCCLTPRSFSILLPGHFFFFFSFHCLVVCVCSLENNIKYMQIIIFLILPSLLL